jgi:hypothetical protein
MTTTQQARLIDCLAGIDFGRRYYDFYERCRGRAKWTGYTREDVKAALATVPLPFTYHRREDFFRYAEPYPERGLTVALNVAFPASTAELILDLQTPSERLGDPFKMLARLVERRRDPSFTFSPPYPDLPFSDPDQLRQAIAFGVALFRDAAQAIVADDGWG